MATAAAITDKGARASELRAEAAALGKEVSQLREKLEFAQRELGSLQDKRREMTEAAANGKQPRPGAVATLTAEISEATIPFDGLTSAVNGTQAKLDTVRANLESLEYELRLDAQRAAREARFQALAKQGVEVAARIGEKLRGLIELDLVEFDQVRDALAGEFVNVGRINEEQNDPEANSARAVIHKMEGAFMDGSFLAVERRLLRAGWQMRGDVKLIIQNLVPPKR